MRILLTFIFLAFACLATTAQVSIKDLGDRIVVYEGRSIKARFDKSNVSGVRSLGTDGIIIDGGAVFGKSYSFNFSAVDTAGFVRGNPDILYPPLTSRDNTRKWILVAVGQLVWGGASDGGASDGNGIYTGSGEMSGTSIVDLGGYSVKFTGTTGQVTIGTGNGNYLEVANGGSILKSDNKLTITSPRITFGGITAGWVPAATQTDAFGSFLLGFNNSTGDWFRAPGPTWFSLVNIGNTVGTAVTDLALTAGTDVLVVPGTTTLSDQGNAFSVASAGVVARSGTAANGQPLEIEASVSFVPASTAVYELTIGIDGVYESTYPEVGGNGFAESVTCVAGETCPLTAKAHSYGLEPGVTISVGMNTTVSNTVNIRRYSLSGKIIK